MKKILYLLKWLLKISLIYFLCFIWCRFIFSQLWMSALVALGITFIFEIGYYFITKKSKTEANLKLKEKEDADDMYLSLMSDKNYLDFFFNLFNCRHKANKKKEFIEILKDDEKIIIYPYLTPSTLQPNDIFFLNKKIEAANASKVIVCCYDYSKEAMLFAKNYNYEIVLLNRYESFMLLYKEYDFYPQITLKNKKEAKLSFKDLLAFSFNKARTKGYVISSIFLFITSFFVKLNIYYLVFATILLLLAIISYINPKYNSKSLRNLI